MKEVHRRLAERVPEQGKAAIAHGDYRLDNCVCSPDGPLAAVLDWELCTLGDPMADLGMLAITWTEAGDVRTARPDAATQLPGFPTRAEAVARYGERTGRDVSELAYYCAFQYWRLACISEGVYARYAAGAMGDQRDVDVEVAVTGHAAARGARLPGARPALTLVAVSAALRSRRSLRSAIGSAHPAAHCAALTESAALGPERNGLHHIDHDRAVPLDPEPRPLPLGELAAALAVEGEHARAGPLDDLAQVELRRSLDRDHHERARRERHGQVTALAELDRDGTRVSRMQHARQPAHPERARARP